jgi:hypothetical protein
MIDSVMRAWFLASFLACSSPRATMDASHPFCPQEGAVVCADFDHATDPSAGFTGLKSFGTATGVVDPASFVSPPGSMLVTVPDTSNVASAFAPYWETSEQLPHARVNLSAFAEAVPSIVAIAMIWYPMDQYFVALELAMGSVYIAEEHHGVDESPMPIAQVSLGEWHRYGLEIDTTSRTIIATFDGASTTTKIAASQSFQLDGSKRVLAGIVNANAIRPKTSIRFDDVAITR